MTDIDVRAMQEFFFEAAARTYAADMPKAELQALPGSKALILERDSMRYSDCWSSGEKQNGHKRSFGQTVIWIDRVPV